MKAEKHVRTYIGADATVSAVTATTPLPLATTRHSPLATRHSPPVTENRRRSIVSIEGISRFLVLNKNLKLRHLTFETNSGNAQVALRHLTYHERVAKKAKLNHIEF